MRIYTSTAHGPVFDECAVCLGNFDGVHRGHRALITAAAQFGRACAFTFWPHPAKVLQAQLAPPLITSRSRKLELLRDAGVAAVVVQRFTKAYALNTARHFETVLFDELRAACAVVGADFTYGHEREGNVASLAKAAAKRKAILEVIPHVLHRGVVVSSTKVREYVLGGRVEAAMGLLARPFDVDGTIVRGHGRGRGLGYPTANVKSDNDLMPKYGIYAVRAHLAEYGWLDGAASIGINPTFPHAGPTLEVHILDFSERVYGKAIRVEFIARIRDEQRFASVKALSAQIEADVEATRRLLISHARRSHSIR